VAKMNMEGNQLLDKLVTRGEIQVPRRHTTTTCSDDVVVSISFSVLCRFPRSRECLLLFPAVKSIYRNHTMCQTLDLQTACSTGAPPTCK